MRLDPVRLFGRSAPATRMSNSSSSPGFAAQMSLPLFWQIPHRRQWPPEVRRTCVWQGSGGRSNVRAMTARPLFDSRVDFSIGRRQAPRNPQNVPRPRGWLLVRSARRAEGRWCRFGNSRFCPKSLRVGAEGVFLGADSSRAPDLRPKRAGRCRASSLAGWVGAGWFGAMRAMTARPTYHVKTAPAMSAASGARPRRELLCQQRRHHAVRNIQDFPRGKLSA